ncbi:ComEC/Rec2 family competence protein [Dongia rigui]|uniref:Metallo-beta-lactamase domain-containing protein n=1 Tax=Dongia rigui TaxID=940149 RepID=A0ABU5DTW7_9PROT|nr:hypothetical protein [Dongia rigui]MDY0870745.1 hypothetical protein [Dongia rigui]
MTVAVPRYRLTLFLNVVINYYSIEWSLAGGIWSARKHPNSPRSTRSEAASREDTMCPGPTLADVDSHLPDATRNGTYHFLDVGDEKYGECTLVIFGKTRVLIDGSHRGDVVGRNGRPSIPDQLAEILQEEAPHHISLLVVTHGHNDHIGCLPDLVANEVIDADWALITDPQLGFGRTSDDDAPTDAVNDPAYRLATALREEDASDLDDAALADFLDAAATVEGRYADMIENLKQRGTKVEFYRGKKLRDELVDLLRPTGATLLGPSEAQLLFCAEQISNTNKDAAVVADQVMRVDRITDPVAMYRAAVEQELQRDGRRNPRGNGMNCQSITFAFGPKNARVLLAGDMQFAEPGVKDADDEVRELRERVIAAGPYKVLKTTHHSSHNGQDDDWLSALGEPPIIIHSGGINDASHPYPGVLQMLKRRSRQIRFARTDRNGHIAVRPHLEPDEAIEKARGRLNDFTPNGQDEIGEIATTSSATSVQAVVSATVNQAAPQVIIVNLPASAIDMTVGGIDIVVRNGLDNRSGRPTTGAEQTVPRRGSENTGSLRNDRRQPAIGAVPTVVLASGRSLPNLLFVTNSERLSRNIGTREASAALDAVRAANHPICEVDGNAAAAAQIVRTRLQNDSQLVGIVLLGGYDVVPPTAVDVLDQRLRNTLGPGAVEADDDHYIVWSDEPYGDRDGDHLAERPVSRIPDGRDATLFLRALSARPAGAAPIERFGVRNYARPFADAVWKSISGQRPFAVSEKFLCHNVKTTETTTAALHYFMLHGDWRDGRMFLGERANGVDYTDAFSVTNVPTDFAGIAFSGCCWGALTVSQRARDAGAAALAPRVAERSIALSYLKAGAAGFVGCTGSHYSGSDPDPRVNYASAMHQAFWKSLPQAGYAPAIALHKAKAEYGSQIATSAATMEPNNLARRLKNRTQFTCLGLGW